MAKLLRLYRHSKKDGLDNSIEPKGMELAKLVATKTFKSNGFAEFETLFCGPLPRTEQTLKGMANGSDDISYYYFVSHSPVVINGMGSDAMFAVMTEPQKDGGFMALAPVHGNREAIRMLHTEKMYKFFLEVIHDAVVRMFDLISESDVVNVASIGVFHSPTVEMAAEAFGTEIPAQFPEMSYVDFGQDSEGKIKVVDFWVCDITI